MTGRRRHGEDSEAGLAAGAAGRVQVACPARAPSPRTLPVTPEARGPLSRFAGEELSRVPEQGSHQGVRPPCPARKPFAGWTGSPPPRRLQRVTQR